MSTPDQKPCGHKTRTDRLYIFTDKCNANDAKTPKELYDAIEKLGPLPRYHGFHDSKGKEERQREPAVEEARAVYAHARKIAIRLRKYNPGFPPLPPTEADPFLGLQTVSEWCINTADLAEQPAETDSKPSKFGFHPKEPSE